MNYDLQQLRVLSILHYVVAGLITLVALLPVINVMGMYRMLGRAWSSGSDRFPAQTWFLVLFSLVLFLCGLALVVCLVLAGRYLVRQRHYVFCLVVAGVASIFFPVGTLLGVFTIVVLNRDSVKELFAGEPPAAPAADG